MLIFFFFLENSLIYIKYQGRYCPFKFFFGGQLPPFVTRQFMPIPRNTLISRTIVRSVFDSIVGTTRGFRASSKKPSPKVSVYTIVYGSKAGAKFRRARGASVNFRSVIVYTGYSGRYRIKRKTNRLILNINQLILC